MVVVVISGQSTCGSTTVGQMLARKLGVDFFSLGRVYKELARENVKGTETEASAKFFSTEKGKEKSLHEKLDQMQIDIAKRGNVVIDSKLGIRMIKDADLKVYLKASKDKRVERVAKRDSISLEEAKKILEEKDKLEEENFMKIYGFRPSEQEKEADLVIDTTDKTPEEIVELILSKLGDKK